jgi:large subunit ribosomal protein L21
MSYAVISVGGKQYRVSEGQRLLVDRLRVEDGKTFTPEVLLVGGDGEPQLAPTGVVVTAKVVGSQRGPKVRIGKYKKRTGYKRHTGFRAALTQIEIESIGGARAKAAAKPKAAAKEAPEQAAPEKAEKAAPTQEPAAAAGGLPAGYADMTIAALKDAVVSWDTPAVTAALDYERAHGNRKGAIAALESALAEEGH